MPASGERRSPCSCSPSPSPAWPGPSAPSSPRRHPSSRRERRHMATVQDAGPATRGPAGIEFEDKPEGPIAAAILAAGIGCLAMGVVTTLAEASTSIADKLSWSDRVGPLSGKTIIAVAVWLVAWAVLHLVFRAKEFETRRALAVALVLVALGVVGTFPTFFQAFE